MSCLAADLGRLYKPVANFRTMKRSDEDIDIQSQAELESIAFELSIFELKCAEEVQGLIKSFDNASPEDVVNAIKALVAERDSDLSSEASASVWRLMMKLVGDRRYQEKVGLRVMVEASLSKSLRVDLHTLIAHCVLILSNTLSEGEGVQDGRVIESVQLLGDRISEASSFQKGRAMAKLVAKSLFRFKGLSELCCSLWLSKLAIFYILPFVSKEVVKRHMPELLGAFHAMVLAAKQQQPSSLHMAATTFFLSSMNEEDFALQYPGGEGSVQDALLKILKKGADAAAFMTSAVVAKLSPKLNLVLFATTGGLAGALRMLKSTKAECRSYGHDLFLSLCERLSADPKAVAGAVNQLFDTLVVRSEPAASRSAAAACLISLTTSYPALASAVAASGDVTVSKGMLEVAKYMDKENDRACGIMLGRALGCWIKVFSALGASGGGEVEAGNPLLNSALKQKVEGALKAAKGTLPALLALSEAIPEGSSSCSRNRMLSSSPIGAGFAGKPACIPFKTQVY